MIFQLFHDYYYLFILKLMINQITQYLLLAIFNIKNKFHFIIILILFSLTIIIFLLVLLSSFHFGGSLV